MGLFSFLGDSKKKKLKKKCEITGTLLEYGEGSLLTTSQVIQSRKFWDSIMTEPEAMAYTINHFKNHDSNATMMRSVIFEKYAEKNDPWIVSEDCLNTFGIEADHSKEYAQKWWESEFSFRPPQCGEAKTTLESAMYNEIRNYAIQAAGESRVN